VREQTAGRSLATGKLPVELLADLLAELPAAPPEVRLGPAVGEDACAVEIPGGVLVAATDPITLTGEDMGRWSVIVNANDVAVTGARPRWFLAVVLIPPNTTASAVRELFSSVRQTLVSIDAHLVGGHTRRRRSSPAPGPRSPSGDRRHPAERGAGPSQQRLSVS
jgi:hydrogenase maturation factor